MSPAQDGRVLIWDILASFLDSGRKWRRAVHLYIESMFIAVKGFGRRDVDQVNALYKAAAHSYVFERKYLKHNSMDCFESVFRHSWSSEDELS